MASASTAVDVDDPDPIKASYDVYIQPHLQEGTKLYILQFPNRDSAQDYSAHNGSLPTELRIKPKSGLLELDVPVDAWRNYDREKGVRWGEAMRKSNLARGSSGVGSGSHGLPGGFGIGGAQPARSRGNRGDEDDEMSAQEQIMRDFAAAVTQQRVLTRQTLGGQGVPKENTSPQYMIGAFRKNQLHLTPVDEIVQMRPQFHHIDAAAELERLGRPREPAAPRTNEPRAIHMTVKAAGDEEETTDTMAERIRSAQEEPWRKHAYVDEDSTEAWEAFNEHLFLDETVQAPRLVSTLGNAEYLDAISAPRDAARLSRSKDVRRDRRRGKRKGHAKAKTKEGQDAEGDSSSTLSEPPSSGESDEE
ncbi:MAG: hypothetical protein M1818_006171 [Claussenomyces sp. TS43310]|nr:MAG: hypothetical protein M1818_006171 [Claussenomyces sp. TS43310]